MFSLPTTVRGRAGWTDALLWAALSAPVAWALLTPPWERHAAARLVGSLLVLAVAVLASRRQPLVSLLLVVLPTLVDGNFAFGIPVMSYLLGLRMARAWPAALAFATIALGGSVINFGLLGTGAATWFLLATTLLFAGVFPWLVGRYRRQHRELMLAGWEQAELLEREQRGAAERIRMRERARIAQDMHDSLGHDLSLLALRAAALELAPDLDERHRRAAGELRASVAAATERLREIIGVLREDAEPAPTGPVAESVADLVERAREAGLPVRLREGGPEPAATGSGDRAATGIADAGAPGSAPVGPAMVRGAAYRVVQEALTNAARYAPGAAVTVRLEHAARWTRVRVVNARPSAGGSALAGPGASAGEAAPGAAAVRVGAAAVAVGASGGGTGSGLLGLRERVRLVGGTLRAGPRDGGFEVLAYLPHERAAAGSADAGPVAGGAVAPAGDGTVHAGPRSAVRLRAARQRVRRSLLLAVAAPVAIAAALCLAYYPFATLHTVLPDEAYQRLRVGQQRAELAHLLPARQVRQPDDATPPAPAGTVCEFYTDGNFPLALASYRLCFADGRLVAKDRLSGEAAGRERVDVPPGAGEAAR
ncbi:histidine kinase [Micromonospora sp. NPDC049559]|uniref:sensor histidine kinase n=1 Tax=Micromonospora sp. NPDC049559 TaxID=3155923 RepID=UPI0034287E03